MTATSQGGPSVWEAALVSFLTSPQGQQMASAVVTGIVNAVLAARGHAPASPAEIGDAASASIQAVAAQAKASGDAFDAAAASASSR